MSSGELKLPRTPSPDAAGPSTELELLELRRRRLQLEAEVAAVEEQIARARLSSSQPLSPPTLPVRIAAAPVEEPGPILVPFEARAKAPAPRNKIPQPLPPVPPPVVEKREPPPAPNKAVAPDPTPAETPPEEPAEPARRGMRALFVTVPSWLVSMSLHVVVVLVLAMFYLPQLIKPPLVLLEGTISEPVTELITSEATLQLDALAPDVPAVAPDAMEPGMIAFGESAESQPLTEFADAAIDTGDAITIGALFGKSGEGMSSVGQGTGGAEFFGVKASGNRFVFIVDSSNSMRGDKFQDACEELMYALRRLNSSQNFYIIFFDQNAERMTFAPNKEPEASFAKATPANLKKAEDWVKTVQNELKTDPYDAVVFACGLVPDAIYLLSDGKFTDKGATERFLKANNLFQDPGVGIVAKSVVHTVGFYDTAGEEALKRIAAEHKGTYRFVPRPVKK